MTTELARIDDEGDRLIVVNMNARRRGALSPDLYACIIRACHLAVETRVRSVILRSEGGFFCAGGNLNLMKERADLTREERRAKVDELHDVIRAIHACPVPVIAVVDGGAAGAGMSLALACDLIVADTEAQFTASYVKAGLVPDGGLTAALMQALPKQAAMELCILGRPMSAQRLFDLGVVNAVADGDGLINKVTCIADVLSAGPRTTRSVIKSMVLAAGQNTVADQLDLERDAMADAVVAPEGREGIAAFLEKRKPEF